MKYIYLLVLVSTVFSCNKKPTAKQGTIEIKTRVFYNASQSLEDAEIFNISKLHFYEGAFMEYVPDLYDAEITDSIFLIKNGKYLNMEVNSQEDLVSFDYKNAVLSNSVFDKRSGAMWIPEKDSIYGYANRQILEDTILNGKDYSRFSIADKNNLTLFWIQKTDTILPYSLNRIADKEYNGRITRIDAYEKERDLFSTVIMEYKPTVEKGIIDILKELK